MWAAAAGTMQVFKNVWLTSSGGQRLGEPNLFFFLHSGGKKRDPHKKVPLVTDLILNLFLARIFRRVIIFKCCFNPAVISHVLRVYFEQTPSFLGVSRLLLFVNMLQLNRWELGLPALIATLSWWITVESCNLTLPLMAVWHRCPVPLACLPLCCVHLYFPDTLRRLFWGAGRRSTRREQKGENCYCYCCRGALSRLLLMCGSSLLSSRSMDLYF